MSDCVEHGIYLKYVFNNVQQQFVRWMVRCLQRSITKPSTQMMVYNGLDVNKTAFSISTFIIDDDAKYNINII